MADACHNGRLATPEGGGQVLASRPAPEVILRALTPAERDVILALARGLTSKEIASELGLTGPVVSRRLAGVRTKLAVRSTCALVRLAASLAPSTEVRPLTTELTACERAVLDLVRSGYSNREIASIRGRAQNTIANQIAGLLRKTGSASRRALIARTDLESAAETGPRL